MKKQMNILFENWRIFLSEGEQFTTVNDDARYKILVYPSLQKENKDNDLFTAFAMIINNCFAKRQPAKATAYIKGFNFDCKKPIFLDVLNSLKTPQQETQSNASLEKTKSYMPQRFYELFPTLVQEAFKRMQETYLSERSLSIWQRYFDKYDLDASTVLNKLLSDQRETKIYISFTLYNSGAAANALANEINVDAYGIYTAVPDQTKQVIVHELIHDLDERLKQFVGQRIRSMAVGLPGESNSVINNIENISKQARGEAAFYKTEGGQLSSFSVPRYESHLSAETLRGIEDLLLPRAKESLTMASMIDPRFPTQKYYGYELDPTELYVRIKKLQNFLGGAEGYITFEDLKNLVNNKNPNKFGSDYDMQGLFDVLDTSSDDKIQKIVDFFNTRVAKAPTQKRTQVAENKRKLSKPSSETNLGDWFKRKGAPGKKGGWVDCNTCRDGKCKPCGRQEDEKRSKYPRCRPTPSQCKGYKRRGSNLQKEE